MYVTTNFQGKYNAEVIKHTDVAFHSDEGNAEWNYRMVWKLCLPSRYPRIKIAVIILILYYYYYYIVRYIEYYIVWFNIGIDMSESDGINCIFYNYYLL